MKNITIKQYQELVEKKVILKNGELTNKIWGHNLDMILKGKKYYTHEACGKGRYSYQQEKKETALILVILDTLEIKYISGNDAPKGGKLGNYIKLSRKRNIEVIDFKKCILRKGEK